MSINPLKRIHKKLDNRIVRFQEEVNRDLGVELRYTEASSMFKAPKVFYLPGDKKRGRQNR